MDVTLILHYDSVYQGGTNISLKVITYNPAFIKLIFYCIQLNGIDALDTLHKMYDHIYNIKELLQQKSNTKYSIVIRLSGGIVDKNGC